MKWSEKNIVLGLHFIAFLILVFLAFFADGTGDEGDSVFHYLYAKYAFQHPEHFLNQWAKPIYVLFFSIIAQFGFIAVKIANVILLTFSSWIAYKIVKIIDLKYAWLIPIFIFSAPVASKLGLSGLTEPLFAFWLILGIYGLFKQRTTVSIIWLSFLPFVRSEGLIVACVLCLFLALKKQWKAIPLLAIGHLVYMLAGLPYHKDIFWVFTKMSYAVLSSVYGKGPIDHFFKNMPEVLGSPLSYILAFGMLMGAIKLFLFWFRKISFRKEYLWLIYGTFTAYFIAHSLFWYLGIFNSFGLMRVMLGVLPIIAIICLQAFQNIENIIPTKWTNVLFIGLSLFLFYDLVIYVKWKEDYSLKAIQRTQLDLGNKYKEKYQDYIHFYDAIYPAISFDHNIFSMENRRFSNQMYSGEPIPEKSIVIWDDWFSEHEKGVSFSRLNNDKRFKLIECVEHQGKYGLNKSCLFEYIGKQKGSQFKKIDFESGKHENLDSLFVYEGKFSQFINRTKPYSSNINAYLNGLMHLDSIEVSAQIFIDSTANIHENEFKLVYETSNNYRPYSWTDIQISGQDLRLGEWNKIQFKIPIRKPFTPVDRMKIYFYSTSVDSIWIDNIIFSLPKPL